MKERQSAGGLGVAGEGGYAKQKRRKKSVMMM